ncbi:MAG: ester cyclase, partial [Thermomicrobiaceae bacterium]|nr:ester cyclase [Thermomicrobiaceae bacterium]
MTTIRTQSSRAVDAMVIETARLALELIEACNSDDVDRWVALCAPDYVGVDVGQPEPHYGPEGIARVMAAYRGAFPDLTFVETGTVVEPGRIAVFWTARGTHQGTIMHIPATGRAVEV